MNSRQDLYMIYVCVLAFPVCVRGAASPRNIENPLSEMRSRHKTFHHFLWRPPPSSASLASPTRDGASAPSIFRAHTHAQTRTQRNCQQRHGAPRGRECGRTRRCVKSCVHELPHLVSPARAQRYACLHRNTLRTRGCECSYSAAAFRRETTTCEKGPAQRRMKTTSEERRKKHSN